VTGVRREAAALGLLTLAVGCSAGSTTAGPSPSLTTPVTPSATIAPSTTAPGITPTSRTSPTPAPGSKDFGYFTSVESSSPPVLEFDRALFLTGPAADKASAAHGGESPVPNDYYIVNDNTLLRKLVLAPAVQVIGSLQLNSFVSPDDRTNAPKKHTVAQLLAFVRTADGRRTPWNLTYGPGGLVSKVEEQYLP
jgi:hypothetical protein